MEIGVTSVPPEHFDQLPACTTKLRLGTWLMSGCSVLKDTVTIVEFYGIDLESLNEDDRVGVVKSSAGELIFYVNGISQGVAATGLPRTLYALVNLYGKCVEVRNFKLIRLLSFMLSTH